MDQRTKEMDQRTWKLMTIAIGALGTVTKGLL